MVNGQSKFFIVAKIAELLRSPQRCSRITIQNQEMIVEKNVIKNVFFNVCDIVCVR